jgi:hypothetical protein
MFKQTSLTQLVDDFIVPCEFNADDGQGLCVTVAHVFHSVKEKEQLQFLLKAGDIRFTHNTWAHSVLMVSSKVPEGHMLTVATHDGEIDVTKFNRLVNKALKDKKYAGPEGRSQIVRVP